MSTQPRKHRKVWIATLITVAVVCGLCGVAALVGTLMSEPETEVQATQPAPVTSQSPTPETGETVRLGELVEAAERRDGYERDLFGDYDRDSLLSTNRADWPDCEGFYSLADDQCYSDPGELDVDHVVALGEAWDSGAYEWSAQQRDEFAGDVDNLWLMTDNLNQSKGDQDVGEWLPPSDAAVCTYVLAYVEVKIEWGLAVDPAELSTLEAAIQGCG